MKKEWIETDYKRKEDQRSSWAISLELLKSRAVDAAGQESAE